MTITLLFDLDDTLLVNPMDSFLPAYLKSLSRYLSPFVNPEAVIQALLNGTERMLQNQLPFCTLREVFDAYFFPSIGLQRQELQPHIDRFYEDEFPSLQKHTRPMPGCVDVIEQAIRRGCQIGIATSPLFPLTAIEQRLEWAGLSPKKYPFIIIPSYESMHFAKPDPAYFAELLAGTGWPDGPVVMVGDDFHADIQPANQLGIPTYRVNHADEQYSARGKSISGTGPLTHLFSWLDQQDQSALSPRYNLPDTLLAILRATPAALHTMYKEVPSSIRNIRAESGEWRPNEILCHLRDVELEVNIPRLRKIISQPNPFLAGIDSDRWAEERQYILQDGTRALKRYMLSRYRTLRLLTQLKREDWQKSLNHAIFGPTKLVEIVNIIAGHDRLHTNQMLKMLQVEQARQ